MNTKSPGCVGASQIAYAKLRVRGDGAAIREEQIGQ